MATVDRTRLVRAGDWRTLETFWGFSGEAQGVFRHPVGAMIKVRYGLGWFGFNRQTQTLDGTARTLEVGNVGSASRARMQMRVSQDAEVSYVLHLPGP